MGSFYSRKGFMLCITLLLFHTLKAQQHYTLQQLIDSATANLPLILQKKALINSSMAGITEAQHSSLPQIRFSEQLNVGTDNSLAGSYLPLGSIPSTSGGIRKDGNYQAVSGNMAVLYGEYDLVDFGLRQARINRAKSDLALKQSDLDRDAYVVQHEVARLYLIIGKDQYQLKADQQNIDRYESIFKVIQALALSGIKPGADSSLAKAELARTKINYNQTLGRLNQLKEQLGYLTGISGKTIGIDFTAEELPNKMMPDTTINSDTSGNPLIQYYLRKKEAVDAEGKLINKSYQPRILLAAGAWGRASSIEYNDQYKALSDGFAYQRFNYMLGVGFTYNLFNSTFKHDKLAINRFQSEASAQETNLAIARLHTQARQADLALQTTSLNLEQIPVQLQSAEATYQQKLAQYRAGMISLIDLTNASYVLYRSQTDYATTLSDWYLSRLDKAAATGSLHSFIQTIQ